MRHGAVAAGDRASAEAGAEVLRAGGNAVDAAVATVLASAVSLPTLTGPGGAGLLALATEGGVEIWDFFAAEPGLGREHPALAPEVAVTLDFQGEPERFVIGAGTVGVPGLVAGLFAVHRRHGTMPMREVAAPAIALARRGFRLESSHVRGLKLLEPILRSTGSLWRLIAPGGELPEAGARFENPDLGETLSWLAEEGPRPFYEGDLARRIVESTKDFVTLADLKAYEPQMRSPLRGTYRGWTVGVPGAPSMTGAQTLCSLAAMEGDGVVGQKTGTDRWSRILSAMEAGEALRTRDYDHRLFERGYLEGRLAACPGGATTHVSVVDGGGRLVSLTSTLGETAGLLVEGTGIILNNFLGEEDLRPLRSRQRPGGRMRTAMCPLIAGKDGDWMALGAGGSRRIRTALLQVLLHLLDGGLDVQDAIDRRRAHLEAGVLTVEDPGSDIGETRALLGLRPQSRALPAPGFYFGGVQGVVRRSGAFGAGSDAARRGGAAIVV